MLGKQKHSQEPLVDLGFHLLGQAGGNDLLGQANQMTTLPHRAGWEKPWLAF